MLEDIWPTIESVWPHLTREEHESVLAQVAERRHEEERLREEEEWNRLLAERRREVADSSKEENEEEEWNRLLAEARRKTEVRYAFTPRYATGRR